MFEDINPNQPQPTPPTEPEKEWGPWKPLERATGPEPRPVNPPPVMPSSPTPIPVMPPEQKPSKRKYILIGIIIFAIIVVLIAGAVVALSYLTNKNANVVENANANVVENANANANVNLNKNLNANMNLNQNANVNANLNQNANINENLNANVNLNQNANVNANVNLNANAVVNANGNLNANVNTNVNANANLNVNTAALDSDNDGLVDAKESLYGTGINNPDTDSDSYKDGAEIENLYSPNGTGQLSINDFKTYCQNYITTSSATIFSSTELTSVCNSGADIYSSILALKIAGDATGAQAKINASQSEIQTKCDALFTAGSEKNLKCTSNLTSIVTDFGKVK